MDVYRVLQEDHREVAKMLERLSNSTERAAKMRQEVFGKLKEALVAHSKAEEKIFYSSISQDDTRELVDEARHEHQEVEKLLKEMDALDVTSPEWTGKLKELKRNVEHHVKEEEGRIFKQAHKLLSDDEADNMGEEIEEEEERILRH